MDYQPPIRNILKTNCYNPFQKNDEFHFGNGKDTGKMDRSKYGINSKRKDQDPKLPSNIMT